jgi:dethiobiotin synthetase
LPVVMVVGLRLGCINHALLTAEAIRARKLSCVGWIANQVDAQMSRMQENISTLDEFLDMPRLGFVEHMAQPDVRIAASRIRLPDELVG